MFIMLIAGPSQGSVKEIAQELNPSPRFKVFQVHRLHCRKASATSKPMCQGSRWPTNCTQQQATAPQCSPNSMAQEIARLHSQRFLASREAGNHTSGSDACKGGSRHRDTAAHVRVSLLSGACPTQHSQLKPPQQPLHPRGALRVKRYSTSSASSLPRSCPFMCGLPWGVQPR